MRLSNKLGGYTLSRDQPIPTFVAADDRGASLGTSP
jgi:hypothetical protein